MGKPSINHPFSIAMLNVTRGYEFNDVCASASSGIDDRISSRYFGVIIHHVDSCTEITDIVQCEAPKIAKLVYNSNFTMVYGTQITNW